MVVTGGGEGARRMTLGMRGFSRSAFAEMDTRTTGFEFSPEMVVKAVRHHLRMTEVPITVKPDDRDLEHAKNRNRVEGIAELVV